MVDGVIRSNSAFSAGGLYVAAGATFNMSGSSLINNNSATGYGGGVWAAGTMNMSGGRVTGNSNARDGFGGGVYLDKGAVLCVGGISSISGNGMSNLYRAANDIYIILGTGSNGVPEPILGPDSLIVVFGSGILVQSGATAELAAYFASDNPGRIVLFENGQLRIGMPPVPPTYSVIVSGGTGGGSYSPGVTVTVTANLVPQGMTFSSWSGSGDIVFADADAASTTFVMPAQTVIVTAIYEDSSNGTSSNMAWAENGIIWLILGLAALVVLVGGGVVFVKLRKQRKDKAGSADAPDVLDADPADAEL